MPPHRGHEFLIDFARACCDELTVMVCSMPDDPIPGERRRRWVQELAPGANVRHHADPIPQEPGEHPDFWRIWRDAIRKIEPRRLDFVFASEPYGERLGAELGARFIPVDTGRELHPFSGTGVRGDPMAAWDALPACVRLWYARRVCLFGPESTGKSTLARRLAERFGTVFAWEHARPLLDLKGGACDPEDIPVIARTQIAIEEAMARRASRVLFCDTSLLLTTVWSRVLFGDCPAWIEREAAVRRYDLTFLLDVDVPWVDDDQRYFPHDADRARFFERCRDALERAGMQYLVLSGDHDERFAEAVAHVERMLAAPRAGSGI